MCRATLPKSRCDMFVHDSCKMSPGAGSGAVPGERSLPAVRARCRAGGQGRGGRDPCPAGTRRDAGYQGRGLPLCRRGPSPPESLLCPGAAAVPAASAPVSCLGEGSAGWRRRRRWEGSGVSPAHFRPRFPGSLLLGFAPRSRRQGAAGEDAPGPGAARRSAPLWLRPRQGCVSPGRASGLPLLSPVPPPRGACGQKERADTLRGSSDQAMGEKLPPRNSPGASRSWCSPTVRPYRGLWRDKVLSASSRAKADSGHPYR